ncbi:MAG: tRNA pseudouridine(13) synthase TruD [Methanomicrobiales archaeon]|nr:tRNA pseudouridine(13) synthase TruD [Methanomicrobiales archaeon]MDD1668296.1 tRNA pseudouridine(13) synthase TruD [Methanomicrobiales archaeon]
MRESPYPLEQSLGISWYATETGGIGGRLREKPEDFVVEEVPCGPWGDVGRYLVLRLTKRNWEQQRLVKEMAKALGISHRRISWAGTKDRNAVTSQYITIQGLEPDDVKRITLPDVRLEPIGLSDHPLALGELRGNRFTILIRDCHPTDLAARVGEVVKAASAGFPNYVGIQRFGALRPVTHLVGEKILRGDLEGAVLTYLGATFPAEPEGIREARDGFLADRDVKEAIRRFPVRLTFERAMLHHLDGHPGDYPGALKALPPRLLSMFVSAFQSFLFNTLLSRRCGEGIPLGEPAPGDRLIFTDGKVDRVTRENLGAALLQLQRKRAQLGIFVPGSEPAPDPAKDEEPGRALLRELGISPENFSFAAKTVSAAYSGMTRPVALCTEMTGRVEGNTVLLGFSLGPGQYATTVCREFMKADPVQMI